MLNKSWRTIQASNTGLCDNEKKVWKVLLEGQRGANQVPRSVLCSSGFERCKSA